MGYAELIADKLASLPPDKQAEIYDFVEFVSSRTPRSSEGLSSAMYAARGSLRGTMEREQLERELSTLRSEWERSA